MGLKREGFYCKYEEEYSQKHLEESRSMGENGRLNMASRLNWMVRLNGVGGGSGSRGKDRREVQEDQERAKNQDERTRKVCG